MRTAAAYIRVSTEQQTEYSPDSQLRLIREYAARNGLLLPEEHVYVDEGISGRKADKRPAFQKMLFHGRRKAFEVILIYHTSRFARNHEESIIYRAMLRREGIDVISITQPQIDSKTDLLMNALYAAMDERYSLDLSENVKRGMVEKAMRGETVNSVPYGYQIPSPGKIPQIAEAEARIVRQIFDMYTEQSDAARAIAVHLNNGGVPSPKGRQWTRERVEQILSNPFYCGYTRYNLRDGVTKKWRDESEWIIRMGMHERIIKEEVFQEASSRRRKNEKNGQPPCRHAHWLSGLVKCAVCGAGLNVVRGGAGGREVFLRCRGYACGTCAETQYTPAAVLERFFFTDLRNVLANPSGVCFTKANADASEQWAYASQALEQARRRLARVKAAYENGIDTLEEYKANKSKLAAEIEGLAAQRDASVQMLCPAADTRLVRTADELIALLQSDISEEVKCSAVKEAVAKIVYSKREGLCKVYYYGS